MIQIKRFGVWNDTLIIGDPHLGKKIYQTDDNLVFDRLVTALQPNEPFQNIIILGDVFDIPTPDYCTLMRFISLMRDSRVQVYILEGNHDQKKDLSKKRVFDVLKEMRFNNIYFVTEPTVIIGPNEENYFLLPYSDSLEAKERVRDAKRMLLSNKMYTLFAHLELDEINEDYVTEAKQVFSGHDHSPRLQNNICWVGSLTPLDKSQDTEKSLFKTATVEEVLSGKYQENFVEVFVKPNEQVPTEIYQKVRGCRIIVLESEEEQTLENQDTYLNPLQLFHIQIAENNLQETYNEIINFR